LSATLTAGYALKETPSVTVEVEYDKTTRKFPNDCPFGNVADVI
jgi:hypothetical protein